MKKISFIVYYPYQWFIYKNIYFQIPEEMREVIVDLGAHVQLQDEEVKNNIISLLTQNSVNFRVLEAVDYLNSSYLKDFFKDVEVFVSCWEVGCLLKKETVHIKKINTTYGIAKELTFLRPTRAIFDVILAYGKKDQGYFSLLTKSIAIGNPRLDNFYNGTIDSATQENINLFFKDKTKKIVIYSPTHGDLSSVHDLFSVMSELSNDYNIIFKPHYLTLREDKEIVERYKTNSAIFFADDSWDIIELMHISDVVISDNSSAIFDAMQVNKPIVVCDFLDKNFLDSAHKILRITQRGINGALTYSKSLEQEIKEKKLVLTIKGQKELPLILKNIEETDKHFRKMRQQIVSEYFERTDGKSSEAARDIILDIYNSPRNHVQGILHHAYLTYPNRRYREIIDYQNTNTPQFVKSDLIMWVYCSQLLSEENVLATIFSALHEKNIKSIYVSGLAKDSLCAVKVKNYFPDKVIFFEELHEKVSHTLFSLIKSDLVLFVKPNVIVEDVDVMLNLKLSCKKDMIFFAENTFFGQNDKIGKLFRLLKKEILNLNNFSKYTLVSTSYEEVSVIEKSAVVVDGEVLLKNGFFRQNFSSFEGLISFLIQCHLLTSNDFIMMPDFFINKNILEEKITTKRLLDRALDIYFSGINLNSWPDKKIMKYFFKTIFGYYEYYSLLKLILLKIIKVEKYLLLSRINFFLRNLEKKIKT